MAAWRPTEPMARVRPAVTERMARPRTSTRDLDAIVAALAVWLQTKLSLRKRPEITVLGGPTGAGFSSDTVLFDLVVDEERTEHVLRLPPPPDAFPLFPWYDLERQVRAMRLVRDRTDVPVPAVPWFEPDPTALGAPFFVMERIDGVSAADVPPYVLEGWVLETTPDEQVRMRTGVVEAIAGIHGTRLRDEDVRFLAFDEPGDTPLRRHVARQRTYYDWIRGTDTFPLIDELFRWLDAHWPDTDDDAVVSWGDARLANVLFRDAVPVAILDWEAVALGPRELDLGWLVFFVDYYQRLATRYGRRGLPGFFERADVVAAYANATGHELRDFEWYLAYAALRQALTSIRVSMRAVHFGERAVSDDPEELIADRPHLERILAS